MNQDALKAALEHNPTQPGKFEGEDNATVYFYFCSLDGDSGDLELFNGDELSDAIYKVSPEEGIALDIASPYYGLHYRSDGFVCGCEVSDKRYAELVEEAEKETECDSDF